jgi:hypothetical protein
MGGGNSAGRQGRSLIDSSDTVDIYASKYNERALSPTISWIEGLIKKDSNHFFDYAEVMGHLNLYIPRYGCDIVFAKSILLPNLIYNEEPTKLPKSLIVVLNSLYLTKKATVKLVDVEKDGCNLMFTVMIEQIVNGWAMTDACRYGLRNHTNVTESWLEPL